MAAGSGPMARGSRSPGLSLTGRRETVEAANSHLYSPRSSEIELEEANAPRGVLNRTSSVLCPKRRRADPESREISN
ncbi:hypothetical protein EVAR_92393_1 [Eumeta japonica]|uniref:Uncharacterized protein n=1 Tax=Eumeta variegata TaxID=151549 RepID=A0A4C1TLT2_EUMVA|nr:hypothetical protein EVAR_92393_1 [Eumeta japonica]